MYFCLSILNSANLRKENIHTQTQTLMPGEPTNHRDGCRAKRYTGSRRFSRHEALRSVHKSGHGALTEDTGALTVRLQKGHRPRGKRWGF